MRIAGLKITKPEWLSAIGNPKPVDDVKKRLRVAQQIDRAIRWAEAEAAKGPGIFRPIFTKNPLNTRQEYHTVSRTSEKARYEAESACIAAKFPKRFPVRITMIRYGSRKLDKGCGLNASLKPVRDGIADYMGLDDADDGYEWKYEQMPAPVRATGVRIIMEWQGYQQ